ncbi:hypothetical protein JZU48_03575 [bacterium]|nr:hypothetical protein [bacterium]
MKVLISIDTALHGEPLQAGQRAIVSDTDGASLIALGEATELTEDERGGFAVPMQTGAE